MAIKIQDGLVSFEDATDVERLFGQSSVAKPEGRYAAMLEDEYCNIRVTKLPVHSLPHDYNEGDYKLFQKNVFLFFNNADRILSDKRMYQTPAPTSSNLSFMGTRPFRGATLGVYVEWWRTCQQSWVCDEDGEPMLVHNLNGSSLNNCNNSNAVTRDGVVKSISIPDFYVAWTSFRDINACNQQHKGTVEPYTLKEVVALLSSNLNA